MDEQKAKKIEDETAFDEEIGSQKKAVRGVFSVGIIVFLVIFGITGWAFYLKTKWLPTETVSTPVVEATPSPTAVPTPIPTPEPLEKANVIIEVLNGSGVSGLAGKTAKIFEDLGYIIDGVGNGDDVDVTEVYIKEAEEGSLWQALDDIEDKLSVSSVSGYLDEDEDVMIRIILGE